MSSLNLVKRTRGEGGSKRMLIVVAVAALFGIWRCRTPLYFKWVAVLFAWMLVAWALFSLGGTLEEPGGDGLISREVRRANENRAWMGIYALVYLVLYWSGAGLFIARMVRAYRVSRAAENDSCDVSRAVEPDMTQRQMMETVLLLMATGVGAWFFWF